MSSAVKPQANFYPLAKAVQKFNFPVTVQIIPTKAIEDFSANIHHKVTLLCQHMTSNDVIIKGRHGVETTLPMSDVNVQLIPLYNNATYHTISDVIRNRKEDFMFCFCRAKKK